MGDVAWCWEVDADIITLQAIECPTGAQKGAVLWVGKGIRVLHHGDGAGWCGVAGDEDVLPTAA